ncbi:polyphosphate kinase 1, partial [bacterium]|nr:polyphosphate kinase 1 [bacterium]
SRRARRARGDHDGEGGRRRRPVQAQAAPRPALQGLPVDRFVNRELSWLAFNARVLDEALDPTVPLLERLKFLAIVSSNLDEFFMVRIAGVKRMIDAGIDAPFTDGLTARETFRACAKRCQEIVVRQHKAFLDDLQPRLEREGVRVLSPERLDEAQRTFLREYFRKTILPVVTPLAIDPGHPFPYLANRTICLAVTLSPAKQEPAPAPVGEGQPRPATESPTAFVHIPSSVLPRFVRLPSPEGRYDFVALEDAIRAHIEQLFHGYDVKACSTIRVTRDWDLVIDEESAGDLLKSIEEGIRARREGAAVRLQYEETLPPSTLELLVRELELEPEDLYPTRGSVAFSDLLQIYGTCDLPQIKDAPIVPQRVPAFERGGSTFEALRKGDVLVHHPFQSFDYVVRFVREAAEDPNVLAIKMTLYRTGGGASPIVEALGRAARNGKQVAVLMELKARFDEQTNIDGARRLEQAGAHVIYGLVGLKTHCKACLVVRREDDRIKRYVHLSTGNYNARTAWVYADYGVFSAREELCEDVTQLFNVVTGYCKPPLFHHLTMAPYGLRQKFLDLIRRERANAAAGHEARIVAQMNAIVDPEVIDELYLAGKAGTKIDLIVRGICCLRAHVPGLSENIRVIQIVDRFLEHARSLYLWNDGKPEIYLSSADWMPRNLDRRIELLFPVLDPALQAQVHEALEVQLRDEVKSRELGPDGRSVRPPPSANPIRSQLKLYEIACRIAASPQSSEGAVLK